uniref:Thioesterase in siderophore biosynthesis gene cluster n=1 Tax=Rheinheimera sp. BAL341 TaxID=1708203 RepID=A0A486XVU9_9GAMM
MMESQWFVRPKRVYLPRIRLICLPYAGGGVRTYQSWATQLPDEVELVAVQPPGRGGFMGTPAYKDMSMLVSALIDAIFPLLDRPFVLFGHSLGSRVAFELLHQLQLKNLRLPELFIASGSLSPDAARTSLSTAQLSDEQFIAKVRQMNGTPEAVLENRELMSILLPLLRADFQLSDTYCFTGSVNFPLEVHVLGGQNDVDVPLENLSYWGNFFSKNLHVHTFAGGHFFIETQRNEVIALVRRLLQSWLVCNES